MAIISAYPIVCQNSLAVSVGVINIFPARFGTNPMKEAIKRKTNVKYLCLNFCDSSSSDQNKSMKNVIVVSYHDIKICVVFRLKKKSLPSSVKFQATNSITSLIITFFFFLPG